MVCSVLIWSMQGAVRPHKSKSVQSGPVPFLSAQADPSPFRSIPDRAAPPCLPVCPVWRTKRGVLARKKQHWAFYRYIIQDKQGTDSPLMNESQGSWCKSACCVVCTAYTVETNVHKLCVFLNLDLNVLLVNSIVLSCWLDSEIKQFFTKVILQQAVVDKESAVRERDKATGAETGYY